MDIGDDKKEHQEFFFQNPYEKYVFQSLIYNYLVSYYYLMINA